MVVVEVVEVVKRSSQDKGCKAMSDEKELGKRQDRYLPT
jgi:hypothetical protein